MGRAGDLFDRIMKEGEGAIDAFIMDRQSEELFLDFKRSADDGKGLKLHDKDRANLSKAISGFGNSEGGVIVWGIDCRDDGTKGDVAQCKVPIDNPKRFLSRLEGVISGCTVPVHSHIRHQVVEIGNSNTGFVATYIPKSYLAPHQTVSSYQYYMRAGSSFSPVPHAVLSGMFGQLPQPFVFHNWVFSLPEIKTENMVHVSVELALVNGGPGIARELYINTKVFCPSGKSKVFYNPKDQDNWTGTVGLGHIFSIISRDGYRLPPGAVADPFSIELYFNPPFESDLIYEISFGHQNWPMRTLTATVDGARIAKAYSLFIAGMEKPTEATQKSFLDEVFPFGKEGSKSVTQEEYERRFGNSVKG